MCKILLNPQTLIIIMMCKMTSPPLCCSCNGNSDFVSNSEDPKPLLTTPLISKITTAHPRKEQKPQTLQKPQKSHLSLALKEAKSVASIAFPMILTGLLLYSRSMISMLFLGRLGDLALAGGSLAVGFANITGYSILSCLAMGMEPICGQAFGAKKHTLLGLCLQRTVLLLVPTSIPISIRWLNMKKLLILCGQDEAIAIEAQSYLLCSLPDLLAQSLLHPLRIYLRSQSITLPLTFCATLAIILHIPINYSLVSHLNLGIQGVALSGVWSNFNLVISLILYIIISGVYKKTWAAISMECFREWKTLLNLAIPSCISVCLEWWWYKIMILLCGLLLNPRATVASMGLLIKTTSLIYIFPSSLSFSVSTRVGNEIGANNPKKAKLAAIVGLCCSFTLGLTALIFAVMVRNIWASMLTSSVLPIIGFCELENCPQTTGCGLLRGDNIVKPVSKDDIKMVWQQCVVVQSRKSRSSNVTIKEIMQGASGEFASGKLLQGPGELEDLDCISFNFDFNYNEDHKKEESSKKKKRKRDRNMDDEEDDEGEHDRRVLAKKKARVVWSNSLHKHFLLAIRHIGLDKAVPKRILEFMNVPGLTRENVASHLQKYRMHLKQVAEKPRLSKRLSEKSLGSGLPSTSSFNHAQQEQYAEYLKQQLQMNDLGLAPPLQNTLAPLGTASHLGSSSLQFLLNYNQLPAALNLASTSSGPQWHQLFGSGQSHLLMNNTLQQQRPMQLGNGMNTFSEANHVSGFGMQMMNNGVNGLMNGGTNWLDICSQQIQAKQLQQALNFTFNPFNFGTTPRISSPSIDNLMSPFNNANLGPNFGGRTSQPAGGFNNIINGGYNGLVIDNEVVNGLTNGVPNVNLNGTTFNAPTLGNIGNNASSSLFEASSANPFAPILPRTSQQQQNASLLLSPHGLQQNPYGMSSTVGGGINDFPVSALTNNATRNINNISLANGDDDIMVINNLVLQQQLDNCQPPSHQKQGGEEVPVSFPSMACQDEDPAPTPTIDAQGQLNTNRAANGLVQQNPNPDANSLELKPSPTPTVNSQVQHSLVSAVNDEAQLDPNLYMNDLNSNAAANRPLDLNPTANQVGNPVQEAQGGDQQILNSEFNSNMSSLFDQQLASQEDDYLNWLLNYDDLTEV